MRTILLYCNWGVYIDKDNRCHIPSVHKRYLTGLKNLGFDNIYLLTRVSTNHRPQMDTIADDINIIPLPWFDSYPGAIKSLVKLTTVFKSTSNISFDKAYLRTFEPFGWLLALFLYFGKNVRKNDIVMHFISDPKSAIYSNARDSFVKKNIRYLAFYPDMLITSFVASFFSPTSNGPVPIKNLPSFLTKKMKMVIESALLQEDVDSYEEYNKVGSVTNVLYVGYLRASKGVDKLIEGVKILRDSGCENFILTLVGDGDYRKELEEKVKEYNLHSNVNIVGYVPFSSVLFDYYKKSEIFVNVSPSETGPRVLLEAKVFNNFLVSTDVGYASEIIDNESGVIIDGEPESIANAIRNYIDNRGEIKCVLPNKNINHNLTVEQFFKEVLNVS